MNKVPLYTVAVENIHSNFLSAAKSAAKTYCDKHAQGSYIVVTPTPMGGGKGAHEMLAIMDEALFNAIAAQRMEGADIGVGLSSGYVSARGVDRSERIEFQIVLLVAASKHGILCTRMPCTAFPSRASAESMEASLQACLKTLRKKPWEIDGDRLPLGNHILDCLASEQYEVSPDVTTWWNQ